MTITSFLVELVGVLGFATNVWAASCSHGSTSTAGDAGDASA